MKRSVFHIFLWMVISGLLFSCSKEKSGSDSLNALQKEAALKKGDKLKKKYKTKKLTIDGLQETIPNNSSATGTLEVEYRTDTKVLELSMSFKNLTAAATAAHIHGPGAPGVNAPVIIPLAIPNETSGTFSGNFVTTNYPTFNEEHLLNGLYYINIHNSSFPAGEIRGQIIFK